MLRPVAEVAASEASEANPERAPQRLWIAALLPILLLLPFLNKAVHIDDPLFIWMAQHLLEHPLDPYGFDVNWYSTPEPMHVVNQNPPLLAYYLALVGAIAGFSEPVLHAGMLLWTALACAAMFFLARRFTRHALFATLLAVFTPAFFVSATTIMTDVPMLALWLSAIVMWMRGLEDKGCWNFAIAAILIGLATLTKYFAISLVPLLCVYTLLYPARRWNIAWLAIPLALGACFEFTTWALYGRPLFLDAIFYASNYESDERLLSKSGIALSFSGGLFLPLALALLMMALSLKRGVQQAGLLLALLILGGYRGQFFEQEVQWWVFVSSAAILLFAVLFLLLANRDGDSLLIALWIGGTFVFAIAMNHYVNARVLLPAAPAFCLMLGRFAERLEGKRLPVAALLVAVPLSFAIANADAALANSYREFVFRNAAPLRPDWFSGHWGFQYYMKNIGAESIDLANPRLQPGDVVCISEPNTNNVEIAEGMVAISTRRSITIPDLLTTMDTNAGAGFYSHVWGELPYAFAVKLNSPTFTTYRLVDQP